MKKIFVIISIMSFAYSYGQSIELFYNDAIVNNNDTVTINTDTVNGHYYYLDLVNTSSQNINLMIRREIISLVPGAENYFCFSECLDINGNELTEPISLTAGDTFSHKEEGNYYYFYTSYNPKNQIGTSIIKFNFSDNNDPTDKSSVIFKFISTTTAIADNSVAQVSLNAYPNPATTKVFIQHDLKNQASEARLLMSNLIGVTVKSIPISSTSDKTQIDISDLAAGIYFYSIATGGKSSVTKKLIVK
ncbi:MAG: T9SS type A sorting domain-containing protein [Bacteroidales bacterium]|jgi:hypothetical protein|nr:T9SS type A sorting domain-containing protein [Bacteroidales bacterium]